MELAIGTIVMLILTILLFILSVYWVTNWFSQANELEASIDKQTEAEIFQRLISSNELVVVPFNRQDVKRGKTAQFGVGIKNIGELKEFSAAVTFSGAYAPDGQIILADKNHISKYWLGGFSTIDTFTLKKNEQKMIPLVIKASSDISEGITTPKGDYIFNVCVYDRPTIGEDPPSICPERPSPSFDPSNYYSNRVYQVTLRVI